MFYGICICVEGFGTLDKHSCKVSKIVTDISSVPGQTPVRLPFTTPLPNRFQGTWGLGDPTQRVHQMRGRVSQDNHFHF